MYHWTWTLEKGLSGAGTKPADVSTNTMGGLHILLGSIVPLTAHDFVVVDSYGTSAPINTVINTIVATDPSVATPVSAAQQEAAIQAEKAAYAGQ